MQAAEVAATCTEGRAYIFGYGSLINNESRCSSSNGTNANHAALVHIKASFGYSRAFCVRSRTGFTALGLRPDDKGEGICGIAYPVNPVSLGEYDLREKDYDRVLIAHEHIELRKLGADFEWCLADGDRVYTYVPKQDCVFPACEDFPIIQTYVDTCMQGCKQWGGVDLMKEWVTTTASWSKHWLNDCPLSRRPWLHRPDYVDIDEVLSNCEGHTLFKHRRHAEEYVHSSNRERGSSVVLAAGTEEGESAGRSRLGASPNKAPQVISLTGIWGCPSRNPLFVGRDSTLESLASLLHADGFAEVTGLGGIGKSSLVSEFCHRHFSGTGFGAGSSSASALATAAAGKYGLIVFLRAESRASIAADIRKFAFDLRVLDPRILSTSKKSSGAEEVDSGAVLELDDDTVIEEFKRHLAVQRTRCLLVFDNLECPGDPGGSSRNAVAPYLPRGKLGYEGAFASAVSGGAGAAISSETSSGPHVLVTRRVAASAGSGGTTSAGLALDSLRPAESLQYLSRSLLCDADSATAAEQGEEDREAAELQTLAERLGHLPLALAQAVAFIKRVDISAKEYLERLDLCERDGMRSGERKGDSGADGDVLGSVYASLSMAVQRIECESPAAVNVLMRLAWLSPENITKRLVQTLLEIMHSKDPLAPTAPGEVAQSFFGQYDASIFHTRATLWGAAGLGILGLGTYLYGGRRKGGSDSGASRSDVMSLFAAALGGGYCAWTIIVTDDSLRKSPVVPLQPSINPAAAITALGEPMLEADRVWETLKQYSLLTVRGTRRARVACIHRMQQSYLRRRSLAQAGTATLCIEQCVWTLLEMWGAQRRRVGDAGDGGSTSSSSGDLLDHILVLAGHVAAELDRSDMGLVKLQGVTPNKTSAGARSPWGMRDAHVSRLAFLLTDVAAYVTQALSRFDTADTLLVVALRLQEAMRSGSTQETDGARQLLADTYHLSGTIGRLRGHYTLARERLAMALRLRNTPANKGQYWSIVGEEVCGDLRTADTLHEIGILELRQGGLTQAHALLSKSLAIKTSASGCASASRARPLSATIQAQRKLQGGKASDGDDVTETETETEEQIGQTTVSATLHQLAVVATLRKEYDEAERLLKQALVLDASAATPSERGMLSKAVVGGGRGKGTTGATAAHRRLVSRAAATQQLGRVCFRRGHLTQARAYLIQSLEIYGQAYGAVMHINVAAVYHQLGSTYHAMRDFDEAFANYQRALDIRLAAFTPDHMDVVRTYAEMAQCELDRGRGNEAELLWQGLQARLEVAVAQAQLHGLQAVSDSETGGDEEAEKDRRNARLSMLLRHLLRALYARRLYFRRRGGGGAGASTAQDAEMVIKLSAAIGEAKKLEGLLQQPAANAASASGPAMATGSLMQQQQEDHGQVSTAVRTAVLDARALVRQEALSVSRACTAASAASSTDRNTHSLALYDCLEPLPEKLERLLSSALTYSDEDDGIEGQAAIGSSSSSDQTNTATTAATASSSSSFSGAGPLQGDVALSRAAKSFLADVRSLVHSRPRAAYSSTDAAVIAQGLFDACDRLRAEVQLLGNTNVED